MSEGSIVATFHMPGSQPEHDIERHISNLSRIAELSEEQKAHIRERRPVSPQEFEAAKLARERFLADKARVQRWHDGDADARREMMAINLTLGSRVQAPAPTT